MRDLPAKWGVLAALCLTAGCRDRKRDASVESVVSEGIRIQLGVEPTRVRCARARCDIELPGGIAIAARLDGDKDVIWESDLVVKTAPLAVYVRTELAALGVEAEVDCGPPLVAATEATRVTCSLEPAGAAWVDVLGDGGLALELVLDDEALRARTEEVDPTGLDELSRALDTDQAQGISDETTDADGGVPQAAQ